jgi:hypothetical protein
MTSSSAEGRGPSSSPGPAGGAGEPAGGLRRELGLWDLVMLNVVAIVGCDGG